MFGIPIPFTVLKGHDYIEDLLERDELVNVQLPQKFNREQAAGRARGRARRRARLHRGRQPVLRLPGGQGPDPPGHGPQHQDHRPHRHRHRRGDLRRPDGARGRDDGQGLRHHRGEPGHRPRRGDRDEPPAGRRDDHPDRPQRGRASPRRPRRWCRGKRGPPASRTTSATSTGSRAWSRASAPSTAASTCCSTSRATPSRGRSWTRPPTTSCATFTINVFSMLVLIREFVRFNDGRPAKILNVASTAGITARPGWVAYAASKAAVVSLSATLAEELAGSRHQDLHDLARPDRDRAAPHAGAGRGPQHDHAAGAGRPGHQDPDGGRGADAGRPEHHRPPADVTRGMPRP